MATLTPLPTLDEIKVGKLRLGDAPEKSTVCLRVRYSTLPRAVPTEKLIAPGPIDGDHYRCWEASDPSGGSLGIGVNLVDQFQGFSTTVMEPFRLCNPVDKNGEGIQDVDTHLVCYTLQPNGGFLGVPVPIQNQFFSLANLDVEEAFALCTPSVKTVPEPGFLVSMASGVVLLAGLERRRRRRERGD